MLILRLRIYHRLKTIPFFTDRFGAPEICSAIKAVETIFYQGRFDTSALVSYTKRNFGRVFDFLKAMCMKTCQQFTVRFLMASRVHIEKVKPYGYRYRSDGLNHSRTNEKEIKNPYR